jgi:hypothetical protein
MGYSIVDRESIICNTGVQSKKVVIVRVSTAAMLERFCCLIPSQLLYKGKYLLGTRILGQNLQVQASLLHFM